MIKTRDQLFYELDAAQRKVAELHRDYIVACHVEWKYITIVHDVNGLPRYLRLRDGRLYLPQYNDLSRLIK